MLNKTIIVGYGLAGFSLAVQFLKRKQPFYIIDQPQWNASRVAAGLANPTVLKRYTLSWNALEFFSYAQFFYKSLEPIFAEKKKRGIIPTTISRIFANSSEMLSWEKASCSPGLDLFLAPPTHKKLSDSVNSKYGYGTVHEVFRLDLPKMLDEFKKQLPKDCFVAAPFDYQALKLTPKGVLYKDLKADQIIFCEGYQMRLNPFFNHLPLVGNKGEMLLIRAPKLKLQTVLKSQIFVVPLELDYFWVGATYNWKNKSLKTTLEGKEWLMMQLEKILQVPYEIVSQKARIRPTVIDRKPLLGQHPKHPNLYVFNGLGTRGSLMAPLLSKWLCQFIFEGISLPDKVNINRFMTTPEND